MNNITTKINQNKKRENYYLTYIKIILFSGFLFYSSKDLIFCISNFTYLSPESIFVLCYDFFNRILLSICHVFSYALYYARISFREFLLTDYAIMLFVDLILMHCIIEFLMPLRNIFLILCSYSGFNYFFQYYEFFSHLIYP